MTSPVPDSLLALRHELHQIPEASGSERKTAARIRLELDRLNPDEIVDEVGGHGILAIFAGPEPGPTVLFRCELDGLPIDEPTDALPYASSHPGYSHRCGHDGHMTMVTALAYEFAKARPKTGRIVLLYQPAEETGEGAARVLDSPAFQKVNPDYVFALHNLPGYGLGSVVVRKGVFAATSCGLRVTFTGMTSHAAEPHLGCSPVMAISQCAMSLASFPQRHVGLDDSAKVTVTHLRVGESNFGITPGDGELTATLRAMTSETMKRLKDRCRRLVEGLASTYDLEAKVSWEEEFPITENSGEAVDHIVDCAQSMDLRVEVPVTPMAWSEDFGHFTGRYNGALFGLGAGVDVPALHNPGYDFPDALLPVGAELFIRLAHRLTNGNTLASRQLP